VGYNDSYMKEAYLFLDFPLWYYTGAFRDILGVWLNFMWFIYHFFSMPLLVRTLFSPWRRMTDSYRKGSIEEMLQSVVMNVMSRVFGAIVRLSLLICGAIFLSIGVLGLFIVLALWACTPVLLVIIMARGIALL
jgi:hypothetical protein